MANALDAPDKLSDRLSQNTSETCNTYNMLKLTRHLFEWQASAEYADYYERALYNHILASQDPDDGMVCYYVPMKAGSKKLYSKPFDDFWCCVGTGMENHAKYGEAIYFHNDDTLWVNLFIPSELNWREKGFSLRQETRYPEGRENKFHDQDEEASQSFLASALSGLGHTRRYRRSQWPAANQLPRNRAASSRSRGHGKPAIELN